jgi:hypothetical protein
LLITTIHLLRKIIHHSRSDNNMVAASLSSSSSSSWPSTDRPRRQAGRRCRRAEGMKWESSTSSTVSASHKSSPSSPSLATMVCLLVVVACCSTSCLSFTMPRQRMTLQPLITEGPQRGTSDRLSLKPSPPMPTSLFAQAATVNNELSEENVSNNCAIPKIVDDDNDDSSSSSSQMGNPAFNDAAESPAPPLNYEEYLTMQVGSIPFALFI